MHSVHPSCYSECSNIILHDSIYLFTLHCSTIFCIINMPMICLLFAVCYFLAKTYQGRVCGPWCDHSFLHDNVCMSTSDIAIIISICSGTLWRFLTSLSKRHDFVTSNGIIKHILPYNSAMETLINYCIFFKTLNFPVLQGHALSLSLTLPRVLKH